MSETGLPEPADLHNADYGKWAAEARDFSDDWWTRFFRRLHDWRAIRPATYAELEERRDAILSAWSVHCSPRSEMDITR
jgi:hypothetical protein